MTTAQVPELPEVLVGTEHPPHPAAEELAVCLADLPTGDDDPPAGHPADHSRPGAEPSPLAAAMAGDDAAQASLDGIATSPPEEHTRA